MPPPRSQGQQAHSGPNLFRRFTNKLRSSSAHERTPRDPTQKKRTPLRMPSMPKGPVPAPPVNDFTSLEQRRAALRARGLLPPASSAYRDANGFMVPLSEQEAELDRRYAVVVEEKSAEEEAEAESEARKIREAWLARNKDAVGPGESTSSLLDASSDPHNRRDDAASLASRDGVVRDRSPVRATFVDAPAGAATAAEIARPLEATVEDFRTAPNSPVDAAAAHAGASRDPPGSPSSHSSVVTEKVSRWLSSSTDMPTPTGPPLPEDTDVDADAGAYAQAPSPASPDGTLHAKPRKEKPPPIVVTTHRASKEHAIATAPAPPPAIITLAAATTALSDSEASTSGSSSRPSLEARGRQAASGAAQPPRLAHTTSSASRNTGTTTTTTTTTTLPALSPTRTVSSSGADSTLHTPTTTSCQRDVSISRGSISHSSDQSHGARRPRRGTGTGAALLAVDAALQVKTGPVLAGAGAGALTQSPIEETDSSEEGEFGAGVPAQSVAAPAHAATATARARPQKTVEQTAQAQAQANRKSFSLFGKKSLDSSTSAARSSSSMSNLRRAFSSGLTSKLQSRPRSSIDTSTSAPALAPATAPKRSKLFDSSHLPASPPPATTTFPASAGTSLPPSSYLGVAVPRQGRTTGVGPRPRQAVAPTMHSRGSILHQAFAIEDDESRRLSEMAFLT
ncbi:hypothetical protein C8Q78DRAFT_1078263 [Trametes maxima]|nr:hypothetical protein C8Q78DRAFT_1078263 [Trametes maxima]